MDNGMPRARPGIDAYPLEFSGSGGEFFRVWIVNVLLTVVTFGFYTPFARRRTAQYFWGHTMVADSPLEFTAQQKKMVVGFLLLVVLYLAFKVAAETGQDTTVSLMMLAGAAFAPYFWGSAMRFRLNATRWRGVRLQFTATWPEVYFASWPLFIAALAWAGAAAAIDARVSPSMTPAQAKAAIGPVLMAVGFALLVTVVCLMRLEFNYKSLLVAKARVGGQPGRWKPVFGDFVKIWLATVGVFLGSLLLVVLLLVAVTGGLGALAPKGPQRLGLVAILMAIAIFVAVVFLMFLVSGPARAYREARLHRLVWNNIGVSHVARFKCDLRVGRYVLLRVKNILFTLLTLGFYRPFALVSEYRMKVDSVTLHVKGGLDQLAGQLAREEQGLGDAIADAAGLDLVG
ncbi:MAG TPA: YjgN family protein [Ramlibacter sp.]|nr:YjgN family protein [Ramlibacter sp.]